MAQGFLWGHGRAAGHAGHDQALGGAGHGEAASGSGSGGAATNIDLKWAQIKKLTISGTSYAGATATLFAVRK